MKLARRLHAYGESFHALLVAEGNHPAPVADLITPGWHCIARTVGAAVTIGTLPLPVRHEGRIVAQIVEAELRGDDWYGRVEAVEEPAASAAASATRAGLAVGSYRITSVPMGAPAPEAKPNRVARRTADAEKRRAR